MTTDLTVSAAVSMGVSINDPNLGRLHQTQILPDGSQGQWHVVNKSGRMVVALVGIYSQGQAHDPLAMRRSGSIFVNSRKGSD